MVAADLDTRPQMAKRRSASRLAVLIIGGVLLVLNIALHICIETTGVAVDILALAVNGRKTKLEQISMVLRVCIQYDLFRKN